MLQGKNKKILNLIFSQSKNFKNGQNESIWWFSKIGRLKKLPNNLLIETSRMISISLKNSKLHFWSVGKKGSIFYLFFKFSMEKKLEIQIFQVCLAFRINEECIWENIEKIFNEKNDNRRWTLKAGMRDRKLRYIGTKIIWLERTRKNSVRSAQGFFNDMKNGSEIDGKSKYTVFSELLQIKPSK